MKQKITLEQAKSLRSELALKPGDSFSNPFRSDLCDEYRMETGFWLSYGKSRLLHAVTTKDDDGNFVYEHRVEINPETFGLSDEEDYSAEDLVKVEKTLKSVNKIVGLNLKLKDVLPK